MSGDEICYEVLNYLDEMSGGNPHVSVYSTALLSRVSLDENTLTNCISQLESKKLLIVLRPRPSGINFDLISITELGVAENTRHLKLKSMNELAEFDTIYIFISYAKEDFHYARKLYDNLNNLGFEVWLDKEKLLPGQNWEVEIPKAVRKSKYFIPLFTNTSVSKRGFVQREFRIALEVALEIPEGEIFIIPLRLDNCSIPFEQLRKIQYQNMFPDWDKGIKRILQSIKPTLIKKKPGKTRPHPPPIIQEKEQPFVSIVNGASVLTDSAFEPNPIIIKVGQTVTWRNDDSAFHTVTSGKPGDRDSGKIFDSGLAGPSALTSKKREFSVSFSDSGEYSYYCILHPAMNGRIIVE